MRIIPTKIHGVLDYVVGLFLIATPWIFDFAGAGARSLIPIILGLSTLLYSLLTNYELGISGKISMITHLAFDFVSGFLLALSPWLLGFSEYDNLPHVIIGLSEVIIVLLSKTNPEHYPARENKNTPGSTSHAV